MVKLEHPIIFSVSKRREHTFIVFQCMIFVESGGFCRIGLLNVGKVQATYWLQGKPSSARLALDGPQTPISVFLIHYLCKFCSWRLLRTILIGKPYWQDDNDTSRGQLKQLRRKSVKKNPLGQWNWGKGSWARCGVSWPVVRKLEALICLSKRSIVK